MIRRWVSIKEEHRRGKRAGVGGGVRRWGLLYASMSNDQGEVVGEGIQLHPITASEGNGETKTGYLATPQVGRW